MTTEPAGHQTVAALTGVEPAISVHAAELSIALRNATHFLGSDDDLPILRCVHLHCFDDTVTVSATDRYVVIHSPIVAECEFEEAIDVLIDHDDIALVVAALASALKNTGDKENLTARLRLVEHSTHSMLHLAVGFHRLELQTVGGQHPDIAKIVAATDKPTTTPFDIKVNTAFLAIVNKVKANNKAEQGDCAMRQHEKSAPIRCALPDGVVVLLMPRADQPTVTSASQEA